MSGNSIPTAPHPPHHSTGGSGGGSGSTAPGGGGGTDPYAFARQQQRRAENRARKEHLDAAHEMQQQIDALRKVLNGGFRHALDIRLANIGLNQRQSDRDLMHGYHDRVGSLAGAADDNAQATDSQTVANVGNRSRERMNALSEAFANGAGESDIMRAQGASLRNWNANQSEVNRSYFDTLRSVNSSLTDLTTDTRTGRINNVMAANSDRETAWTNYYNQRSETYTQLGNVLGQQAEEYSLAHVGDGKDHKGHKGKDGGMGGGGKPLVGNGPVTSPGIGPGAGPGRHRGNGQDSSYAASTQGSRAAFMAASHASSQAWKNPGVDKSLMNWDGHAAFGSTLHNNQLSSMATADPMERPEGATLRKWT